MDIFRNVAIVYRHRGCLCNLDRALLYRDRLAERRTND